ncbi:hypothetical protein, partial [Xanthomonas campestris]|uniref:hypothetical protein n=1 Tax=Xanthomonas campestris TaxID=339 RepID=UPI003D03FC1D
MFKKAATSRGLLVLCLRRCRTALHHWVANGSGSARVVDHDIGHSLRLDAEADRGVAAAAATIRHEADQWPSCCAHDTQLLRHRVLLGSTPISRTVVKELQPSDPAWPPFAA